MPRNPREDGVRVADRGGLVRTSDLGFHSPSLAPDLPMRTLEDAHRGRAVLRCLLQDGPVLASVLDLVGQAAYGGFAIRSLGQAAAVDAARNELRGEWRCLGKTTLGILK